MILKGCTRAVNKVLWPFHSRQRPLQGATLHITEPDFDTRRNAHIHPLMDDQIADLSLDRGGHENAPETCTLMPDRQLNRESW